MKIVMIGPYPPPIGGISIHMKRAAGHLRHKGLDCDIYDESNGSHQANGVYPIRSYRKFILRFPFMKGDLFHFHSISKKFRIMLALFKIFGKRIILTIHGGSLMEQIEQSNRVVRFVLLRSLRCIDQILCVNEADTQKLLSMGFREDKVVTLPAYIHPIEDELDDRDIPSEVITFLEEAEFAITANGYIRFYQGRDLYGVDMLIHLVRDLNALGFKVRLLFALLGASSQSPAEQWYYRELRQKVKDYGLEEQFLFFEVHHTELYPLLQKSGLFIRPTLTDGYGVSIAEALSCGIPSVASDVCSRPEGTIRFQAEDAEDLLIKVMDVMENYEVYKQRTLDLLNPDYLSGLLAVYERIAAKGTLKKQQGHGYNGK